MTERRALHTAAVVMTVAAFLQSSGTASAEESPDPIRFILNDWTGQLLSANIMGGALARKGYDVEYIQADAMAQFVGLKSGDLHVAMEIWATTQTEVFEEAVSSGMVENLGETGMMAIEEWWYPKYMKEKCPGLPNWEALKEEACAAAFSVPETSPKGRYVGAPVTWGGFDVERVEALDLPFEVIHSGTDAALFAEIESAYQRQAPIIAWVYAPHWAVAAYDGEWVQFPAYEPACYEDPSWGINPDMAYDCGKPRGPIWKAAWSGVNEKWPQAHKAIGNFQITTEEMNALIAKVDLEKQQVSTVADDWLAENRARWETWFE
jgi:glycine betaine/proline transport system substrate-binding protein